MSVRAMTWAFEQDIAPTEKVVLLSLADYANEQGRCWPSIGRLVERARVSERTVQRALSELEAAGFIIKEERAGDDGRSRSNLYRLTFRGEGVNLTPRGDTHDTREGDTGDGGEGDTGDTPLKGTTNTNPKKEPSSAAAEEADFEEFWAAYPKRPNNPKQPAKAKYLNARRRLLVPRETLVNAARAYAASRLGQDPTYTAMAATWLNQRRWEEYAEQDQAAPQGEPGDINLTDVENIMAMYPGIGGRPEEVRGTIVRHGMANDVATIAVGVEMFRLLVKQERYDGFERHVQPLDHFIMTGKWRDMVRDYEFYRAGPTMKLHVRPKRVK